MLNCINSLSWRLFLCFAFLANWLRTALLGSGLPWWPTGEESTCNAGDPGSVPGSGRSPEEGSDNPLQHSCWRIPCTKEQGRLQSMGSQRVGHDLVWCRRYDLGVSLFGIIPLREIFRWRMPGSKGISILFITVEISAQFDGPSYYPLYICISFCRGLKWSRIHPL